MKYIFLLVIFLVACDKATFKQDTYQCDTVIFVTKFPQTLSVSNPESVNIQCFSAVEMNIVDSLMIIQRSKEPFFQVFNLNNLTSEGLFVRQGRGPSEFILSKRISSIYIEDDECIAEIYNDQEVSVEALNITKSINEKRTIINTLERKPQKALHSYFVNDTVEYIYNLNEDYTQIIRSRKATNSEPIQIVAAEKLNAAKVNDIEDIDLVSSVVAINKRKMLVAEAPLRHNQINIYSIVDSTMSKTICFSDQLFPISTLQDIAEEERIRYYGNIKGYDNFFVVLYVEKQKVKQSERSLPVLHFFSWDGKPLVCIQLLKICDSFDIDFKQKKLYTIDIAQEKFFKYDVSCLENLM